jgi:dCTP deaminase
MNAPWRDWIPGVLSKKQLKELCSNGLIIGAKQEDAFFDNSSLDLTLGDRFYRMTQGAIKPQESFLHFLNSEKDLAEEQRFPPNGELILNRKTTYVFPLEQHLNPVLRDTSFYGQATAKSSVGRLDVLARLIVDGMDQYEGFTPKKIASGEIFLEVTPLTFDVQVKPGIALSQLRIFYGKLDSAIIRGEELYHTVLPDGTNPPNLERDGCLTLELSDAPIGQEIGAAFKANVQANLEPVPLWKKADAKPNPKKYWELISARQLGTKKRLSIEKGAFYILRSKQKVALTRNVAVYCRATDETIGEMRIHYAGFAHPFFGRERKDGETGTPLIFEVRGHDIEVILNDGEKLARLDFYRMSEDCEPRKKEEAMGEPEEDYGSQTLKLSNFFAPWK